MTQVRRDPYDFSQRPPCYYSRLRSNMAEYIPVGAQTILDIGCAEGYFGKYLKETRSVEVWGVEIDEKAALIARDHIDNVLLGDVTLLLNDIPDQYFDCIVFNDVLEHLVNPYKVLTEIKNKLTPHGMLVCSIPNVRYLPVLKELMIKKQWEYADNGVLDKSHLRFFTLKSIQKMFHELQFDIISIEGINSIKCIYHLIANVLTCGMLSDTRYMQYVCSVKPRKIYEQCE